MERGEAFFIAERQAGAGTEVLGFASDYAIEGAEHGVSAYVSGRAARQGIGSALLQLAEAHAMREGATLIRIEASLAAVQFCKAHGYTELGRGQTHLVPGQPIACVFVNKHLKDLPGGEMVGSFGSPAPILRVANLAASLTYYTDTLGFGKDWGDSGLASVSRGSCTIFLTEWDQGCRGTWVWIGVDDAGTLHEELVVRGARIRVPPTNYDWAFEMQVEDLDGNVLRLGSKSKDGVPYGDFLDAAGVRWPPTPASLR